MNGPLAIGLIGVGRHGERYARHLAGDVRGARLAALSRRNEKEGKSQATRFDCSYHARWEELVHDPAVDAVCLNVPPGNHLEMAKAVARAGKPLLIEKPLATSAREARAIVWAFEKSGQTLMVAHTLRYSPVVRTLKARLGFLGPIRAIHGAMRQEPVPHAWKRDPNLAGGGCILQIGVHLFDTIRFLTADEVSLVLCQTQQVTNPSLEDVASAILTLLSSKTICTVETSKVSGGRTGVITVVGEGGQLVADFINGTLTKVVGRKSKPLRVSGKPLTIKAVIEDFSHAVRLGGLPPITGEDGLQAVRIAEACYRSAEKGRAVSIRH